MKKLLITFGLLSTVMVLVLIWVLNARQSPKKITIGILNYTKAAENALIGFKKSMEELGYPEGERVIFLYRGAFRDRERLLEEGKWLIEQKVDLIFAMSTPASLVAKQITADNAIPVVFGPVNDAVETGIVSDLRKPDGNLTGIMFGTQEVKRLEWMTKLIPGLKRIYVPYNPKDKSPRVSIKKLAEVVPSLDLEMVLQEVSDTEEIEKALASIPDDVDGIFLPTDSFMAEKTSAFALAAIPKKLPVSCPHRPGVQAGALFSYGFDQEAVGVQAARLAYQIINGIPPRDLPIEIAELFLTINIKTAESIGLDIDENILSQAIIFGR